MNSIEASWDNGDRAHPAPSLRTHSAAAWLVYWCAIGALVWTVAAALAVVAYQAVT